MKDILIWIGLGLGIILIVIGSKVKKNRVLKIAGISMVSISLIVAIPDIASGFVEGFNEGFYS